MDIFIGAYSLLRRRPHSAGARDDTDQRLMEAETARQSCGYATPTLAGPQYREDDGAATGAGDLPSRSYR
jgi:hypothetical protein